MCDVFSLLLDSPALKSFRDLCPRPPHLALICVCLDIIAVIEQLRPAGTLEWENVCYIYNSQYRKTGNSERSCESIRRRWK
jgi:hypothetical protein